MVTSVSETDTQKHSAVETLARGHFWQRKCETCQEHPWAEERDDWHEKNEAGLPRTQEESAAYEQVHIREPP